MCCVHVLHDAAGCAIVCSVWALSDANARIEAVSDRLAPTAIKPFGAIERAFYAMIYIYVHALKA